MTAHIWRVAVPYIRGPCIFHYLPDILAIKWRSTSKKIVLNLIMLERLVFKDVKNFMEVILCYLLLLNKSKQPHVYKEKSLQQLLDFQVYTDCSHDEQQTFTFKSNISSSPDNCRSERVV